MAQEEIADLFRSGRPYDPSHVTINVCTVDRHEQLLACLQSLIATTPQGVRLNLIFNGTPAKTVGAALELTREWQGPFNYKVLSETVPLTDSHNMALAMTQTPLVNFMGDDDLVLGPRLPAIIEAFNRTEPEPIVVTSFARRIAGDAFRPRFGSNKELGPTSVAEWQGMRDRGDMFEMLWPGAVLNTNALRSIGGLEREFERTFDNRIFTRLSAFGPVMSIPNLDFGYRIHEGSLSSKSFLLQSQQVRHVQACRRAEVNGCEPPSVAEFLARERGAPALRRVQIELKARSRMHFRRGSSLLLAGDSKRSAGLSLIMAAVLWPPAFAEKLRDQRKPLQVFDRINSSTVDV